LFGCLARVGGDARGAEPFIDWLQNRELREPRHS